jgi:hypothetical protein
MAAEEIFRILLLWCFFPVRIFCQAAPVPEIISLEAAQTVLTALSTFLLFSYKRANWGLSSTPA